MRTKQAPTVTMITVIALVLSMLAGFTFSQTSAAQVNEPEQSIAEFSALATYAVDLTALARAGKLETVRGRDAETARVIPIHPIWLSMLPFFPALPAPAPPGFGFHRPPYQFSGGAGAADECERPGQSRIHARA